MLRRVLTIGLVLTLGLSGFSQDVVVVQGKKYVSSDVYNSLVDNYNMQRDLLLKARDTIDTCEKAADDMSKKKCPNETGQKILIGLTCVFVGAVLGVGLGVGLTVGLR